MYTVEEQLKTNQKEVYKELEMDRDRVALFFIWLESKLDKVMEWIRRW